MVKKCETSIVHDEQNAALSPMGRSSPGAEASRRSPDARGQRARVRAAHLLQGAVLPDHLQGRGGDRVLMCNIMYTYAYIYIYICVCV